ncbi:MAG: ATP-binding cassette domain-containing protein [Lachnospiraceae bacterium]|nr:ATP-binding cassette domain-containing protein [Lachnospiraceae bacterium]
MSLLQVTDLTFCYEGSFDNIFENVSFNVDTDWKLGFIGRNGKGKTTFLNLLLGKYEYNGSIVTDRHFDYFPYVISERDRDLTVIELCDRWKNGVEEWRTVSEVTSLKADPEILYRPVGTLSHGELTKAMLAVLFSGENEFLLIDEPTNHLDMTGRKAVGDYLAKKKGFILVSHDRVLLDKVCDHMLVLNRSSIEVISGNFSVWQENKERKDAFAKAENEKHIREIGKLKASADRAKRWADKNESTKIGFDPIKEPERNISTRSYIGAKTKKMQSRVKNFEKRIDRQIAEKEGLLNDIENVEELKLAPLIHHKKTLVQGRDLSISYEGPGEESKKEVIKGLTFQAEQGDILFLNGENGCGKSSLIKAILSSAGYEDEEKSAAAGEKGREETDRGEQSRMEISGVLTTASGLKISYVSQNTSFLKGTLKDFAKERGLDYSRFLTLLRKLDMSRLQFEKNMEDYSEGQKKKVLIAASLIQPAHLYIWDEPLNYIDVFSRIQIEKLIEMYRPTMILVEHDEYFRNKLATGILDL